ncbi:hypothetical protein [Microcoleus sp. Pol12B4]|uniref:hypothetical protein n=1 Tax=Microcoleus sp. Pol12B4 TaxID=3055395 RepID=UPI002FD74414
MQLPTLTVISCSHATKVRSPIICWVYQIFAIAKNGWLNYCLKKLHNSSSLCVKSASAVDDF